MCLDAGKRKWNSEFHVYVVSSFLEMQREGNHIKTRENACCSSQKKKISGENENIRLMRAPDTAHRHSISELLL